MHISSHMRDVREIKVYRFFFFIIKHIEGKHTMINDCGCVYIDR